MRKQIKSTAYSAQLNADMRALESVQQRRLDEKKAAKEKWENAPKSTGKDKLKYLKIAFLRAKIRFKAAELAYKSALKVVSPYLDEEPTKPTEKSEAKKEEAKLRVKTKKTDNEQKKDGAQKSVKSKKEKSNNKKVEKEQKNVEVKAEPHVKIVKSKKAKSN